MPSSYTPRHTPPCVDPQTDEEVVEMIDDAQAELKALKERKGVEVVNKA
jgi:hypothetical protein